MNQHTPPPKGHNNPPAFDAGTLGAFKDKVSDFTDAAGAFLDLKEIKTEEQSGKATDFVSGARELYKKVDTARKDAKKPHDDAGKAVQDAYKPILDKISKSVDAVKRMQTAWLVKQEEIARVEREKAAKEAEEQRKAAEEAARQSEARNDISGQADAEAAAKEAEKAVKEAARNTGTLSRSATGGGRTMALRTIREAEITNIRVLFMHYQHHPDVADTLRRIANADIRAAKGEEINIPGIKIIERKVSA